MKLTKKDTGAYTYTVYWTGRSNNVKFEILPYREKKWYVCAENKEGRLFNSLWESIAFNSVEEAHDWCVNFKFENHKSSQG